MKSLACLLLLLIPVAASADDGARLFTPCRACHSLDPADRGLPGPNLSGLIGRKVGGDAAFDYSPVLRKANTDGLRWDAGKLDRFLADPAEMFPGLWMSLRGVEDAADRAALVRFVSDPASR
ncbi:c-type cytochrome [Bradyrhizobium sp.]|uniref:c-type cytochrome n=1 Tax=Bradyrhizobium sp. TaxID=376 RepID=UPI001E18B671|nr:c-type cytochrome [Bradyrhizobium sp.]MBI5319768.1 c-type cytochrome [Bradyrhizobium sp.]